MSTLQSESPVEGTGGPEGKVSGWRGRLEGASLELQPVTSDIPPFSATLSLPFHVGRPLLLL